MLTRRAFSQWSLAAVSQTAGMASALAQGYPDRPIKMIVGFPPGNAIDAVARQIAKLMGDDLKQTVYVDNRPGAAGIISHEAVKNAAPDGYTVLMGSSATLAINPSLYRKLPYDPIRDFDPVVRISAGPLYLFTNTATPVKNLKEMIAYVKARPGKVAYGTGGNGTTQHIAMEMLKKEAGIDMLHVPYKGSAPMITDLIGGQVQFAFDAAPSVLPHGKDGRVRLLGISSEKRSAAMPDVPTIAEQGLPGFEAVAWLALLAPKGTPPAVIERLNALANKALKSPEIVAQTALTGSTTAGGTPAELQAFLKSEMLRWGQAVKDSGAQVD